MGPLISQKKKKLKMDIGWCRFVLCTQDLVKHVCDLEVDIAETLASVSVTFEMSKFDLPLCSHQHFQPHNNSAN